MNTECGNKKGVPISWDARGWIRGLLGLELTRGVVRFVSQLLTRNFLRHDRVN